MKRKRLMIGALLVAVPLGAIIVLLVAGLR